MELTFEQNHTISAMDVDCFGRCRPAVLLYLAQEAATGHCDLLKLDWDTMAKRNLFWAVIRTHVQVKQLPRLGQAVTVRTWPMPTTRTAFPRAVVILDEKGEELVQILSLWVLMDRTSRAMILPGKSGVDVPGLLTGCEIAAPGSILPHAGEQAFTRTVNFSELDRNSHMNNTYYLNWVADLLPAAFHKDHPVKEFTVCYLSEATEGQVVNMGYQLSDEGVFQVDGYSSRTDDHNKNTRVFSVKMAF